MKRTQSMLAFGAAALLAVGAATAQVVVHDVPAQVDPKFPGADMIDSSGTYRGERQACLSGMTQQSISDCLREARNAHAARIRGNLSLAPERYDANALMRCNVHTTAENKAACQARVLGMGQIEGTVAGGGLLREVETVVLPEGQASVTIQPQTSDPVVLVPSTAAMGSR